MTLLEIESDVFRDEIGPEKVVVLRNPDFNMTGLLVIDNSAYGVPAGGIRFAENITTNEMVRLARAMTLKFCSYGVPTGGAKSGLIGNPTDVNRDLLIASYAEALGPFIRDGAYYPGPDMGTNDNDLERIFNIVGRPELTPRKVGLFRDGIPVEELFTGFGVVHCLNTIMKKKFSDISHPRIILEGFGKVGSSIALNLKELNYKLTGISTIQGAIYDDDGLDVDKLIELKKEHGDELVNYYDSKNVFKTPKEELFKLSSEYSTDVIIPGARPDVITKDNIEKLSVKAIVAAANIPYAKDCVEILEENGIIAFPDFISNAGEILALSVINNPTSAEDIFNHIKLQITEKTNYILNGAKNNNIGCFEHAKNEAIHLYKKKALKKKKKIERLSKKCS